MLFYSLRYSARSIDEASPFYCFEKTLGKGGAFPLCSHCNARIGTKMWVPPYHVKLQGEAPGDMCRGTGQQFLVSSRFRQLWADSGLSGMELSQDPVGLRPWHRSQSVVPGYYVAFPAHVLTRLDEVASGLVVTKLVGCGYCHVAQRKEVERIRVDESTWDGKDIFYPSGLYGALLITERFYQFIQSNGLTNFEFTPQDDYKEQWL